MHQDSTSPIFSSRKISYKRATFHRARGEHLDSDKFRKLHLTVSFSSVDRRQSRQFLAWPLAHCSSSLSMRRTVSWLDVGVGAKPSHHLQRVQRRQSFPPRPSEDLSEDHRNPAPPNSPLASVWPSYPQSTLRDARRRLKCAERAPCRRRTREAIPSRSRAPGQIRPSLCFKWNLGSNPKLPTSANRLPSLCLAVIARRSNPAFGNRLGPAINRGPEPPIDPAPHHLSSEPRHAHQRASGGPSSSPPAAPIRFRLRLNSLS